MVSGHTGNETESQRKRGENGTGAENVQRLVQSPPASEGRLAMIHAAWATLPEPIRAAMLAMVQASAAGNK